MRTTFETDRLILREFIPSDDIALFELDSNPEVHLFLGNKPVRNIEESRKELANIRQQYIENGIGRWAAILKDSGKFIGWAGLKVEKNVNGHHRFYDLGYRLIPQFWRQGFATEASRGFLDFGFNELNIDVICAYTSAANVQSVNVLRKVGLQYINTFEYDAGDELWFEIRNPKIIAP